MVLISGGMDSCLTAALALVDHDLAFLHVDYGQRTERRERRAFEEIADHYHVRERLIIDARYFSQIGGSSLTDKRIDVSPADLNSRAIPTSYVPFRNAGMLAAAVSWAEVIGASKIFIGAVEEDSSGYPDCRGEFFHRFNEMIDVGTRPETTIRVITPLLRMSKSEIVTQAVRLGAPLHLTWSCYRDEETACGTCDSCALRLRGFDRAGYEDPLPYRRRHIRR